MRNIYLIGMMGSGKTVTGKTLASLLGVPFQDLDGLIENKARMTVSEIFQRSGEAAFRKMETDVLRDSALKPSGVVASGGGIVLHSENVEIMRRTGRVIYLEASQEMLWERLKLLKDRPLLMTKDPQQSLKEIYSSRLPLYERACHMKVATDGQTPEHVAAEIIRKMENEHEKHIR